MVVAVIVVTVAVPAAVVSVSVAVEVVVATTTTTTTTTTLFSYIKDTNITPPANSKANRGRWCVDGLRFFTIVKMNNKVPYL